MMFTEEQLNDRLSRVGNATRADESVMTILGEIRDDYNTTRNEIDGMRQPAPPEGFSDWQSAYNEANARANNVTAERDEIRKRFIDRFFSGGGQPNDEPTYDEAPKRAAFKDLFK